MRGVQLVGLAALAMYVLGCGNPDDGPLPPDVQDPASVKTANGAMARYRSALAYGHEAFERIVTATGVMTDELASMRAPTPRTGIAARPLSVYLKVDARLDFEPISNINYNSLYKLRAQTREARGFLAAYAPDSSTAYQGHLLAWEGYADIFLADLFCSGIPLSTVNPDGSYTLAGGSRTSDVYEEAVRLFDSALTLSSDNAAVQSLAAVGKGRALLALDRYAEAAAAVTAVPDAFRMRVALGADLNPEPEYDENGLSTMAFGQHAAGAFWSFALSYTTRLGTPRIADREGGIGLDYRSSGDPRTAVVANTLFGLTSFGDTMYFPASYTLPTDPDNTFHVRDSLQLASGIEARLIEAEAALRASPSDGQWLTILNHLRQTAWPTIKPAILGPLVDIADPGNTAARVDLLFRERAFWLFLTAHRQGDLRRLIRQYSGRSPALVYPSGGYDGGGGVATYGTRVVVPIPAREQELNSKYTGCIHFDP